MTDFTPLRIDLDEKRRRPSDGPAWSALFAGDCIYKGRVAADPVGATVTRRIREADVSAVNLEAPVRDGADPVAKVGPAHAAHPETPARLADAGFDAALLANNHLMDYGATGLRATREACADAGLATAGAGTDLDEALSSLEIEVTPTSDPGSDGADRGSVDLAVLNACEREFGVAGADEPGTGWLSHPSTERRVAAAAREADVTVVVAHGGVEYVPFPPVGFRRRLRTLVDAGADAVVAHHPHVPQGWEVYEDAPVLYSLGNFLFDSKRPRTRWGLLAEFDFVGDCPAGVDLLPTELHDGRVRPLGVDGGRTDGGAGAGSGRTDGSGVVAPPTVEDHLDYLRRSTRVIEDRSNHRIHWQALAVRLFDHRYVGWLRQGTAAGLSQLVTDPRAALGGRAFAEDGRRTEQLTLLNVIRNESHRDVVETALSCRTGETPDRRTPAAERTVRELLDWTEDEVEAMYGDRRSGAGPVGSVGRAVRRVVERAVRSVTGSR